MHARLAGAVFAGKSSKGESQCPMHRAPLPMTFRAVHTEPAGLSVRLQERNSDTRAVGLKAAPTPLLDGVGPISAQFLKSLP